MKSKINFKNIYFCDFETITFDSQAYKKIGHSFVYLWYLKNKNGDYEKLGNDLDSFFEELESKEENILIYFHNLSFDGDFIFKYLLKNYPDYWISPLEEDNKNQDKNYILMFNNGNKIYSIEYHRVKYKYVNNKRVKIRYTIKFQCTYNLLSSSIDSLGKCFKLQKLEEMEKLIDKGIIKNKDDFYNLGGGDNEEVNKAFIKYIKRDVEIARLSYLKFEENINKMQELTYSKKFNKNIVNLQNILTIGSLVYKISQNFIYNNFGSNVLKKYKINSKEYDFSRNWFYGGWTQFNEDYYNKYLKNLNGVVIDINSSYPYQMTKLLPVGALQKSLNKKWKHFLRYVRVEVKKATIKEEYYNFVILKNWKKENSFRYVRELENFTCYYTYEEWEFILKIYDIEWNKFDVFYCEAMFLLKDMVNELYSLKEYYSQKGEEANKLTYKIMLNSLYGRQCKRKQYETILWVDDKEVEYFKEIQNNIEGLIIDNKKYIVKTIKRNKLPVLGLNGIGLLEVKDNGRYGNILIGAQITSYARLMLWETIYKIGVDKFIYSDTDSIFLNIEEDISKYVEIDKSKLGKWDIECRFSEGKVLGAKRYAFIKEDNKGIKFALSGINNINFDNMDIDKLISTDTVLYEAQSILERDDYGILIKRRDFKIKKGGL